MLPTIDQTVYFNPRTSYEVRRHQGHCRCYLPISIHVPHTRYDHGKFQADGR